jgi:hypothetical protein
MANKAKRGRSSDRLRIKNDELLLWIDLVFGVLRAVNNGLISTNHAGIFKLFR